MPLPYVAENILATGFRCYVRIGENASNADIVGFVESFNMNESYQTQEAKVLGQIMPISIDAQGYRCDISLSGFVPSPAIYDKIRSGSAQMGYTLKKCLLSFVPDAKELMDNAVIMKFPYLDFIENLSKPKVLAYAEGVIISSTTLTAQDAGYLKYSVSMQALVGQKGYE